MILARNIGTLTLSRSHPALSGATLRCFEAIEHIGDLHKQPLGGETMVAWDLCGSGPGDLVAVAEGPEASQPFAPDIKPLDASIVAILDEVSLG